MKIGFTGTRHGMSEQQRETFARQIRELNPSEFHHGDCIGADDDAANIVDLLLPGCLIVCHPPNDATHRARNPHAKAMRPPLNHLARNREIVSEAALVIATPIVDEHQNRGGTWYTIDFARKCGKRVIHIKRDGTIAE